MLDGEVAERAERLAWYLPDDFNRRPRSEQTKILDWRWNVIVSGSTGYRRYQTARCVSGTLSYCLRFRTAPQVLDCQDFVRYQQC